MMMMIEIMIEVMMMMMMMMMMMIGYDSTDDENHRPEFRLWQHFSNNVIH